METFLLTTQTQQISLVTGPLPAFPQCGTWGCVCVCGGGYPAIIQSDTFCQQLKEGREDGRD